MFVRVYVSVDVCVVGWVGVCECECVCGLVGGWVCVGV